MSRFPATAAPRQVRSDANWGFSAVSLVIGGREANHCQNSVSPRDDGATTLAWAARLRSAGCCEGESPVTDGVVSNGDPARTADLQQAVDDLRNDLFQVADLMLEENAFGKIDLVGDIGMVDSEPVAAADEAIVDDRVGKLLAEVFEDQAGLEIGVYAHVLILDNPFTGSNGRHRPLPRSRNRSSE